ncbi:substrate-binding domain-containing protein [Cryptosporangium japonicum]
MGSTPRRPRLRMLAGLTAVAAAVALSGCTSSTSGTTDAKGDSSEYAAAPLELSDAQRDAILKKAFLTDDVKAADLDPTIVQGLEEAGRDYSDDQIKAAAACLDKPTCTIGKGEQTLAILDGAGSDLWRRITRAQITVQATSYPNIGTVIYLQADGNLQTMQANLQTLIARKVTGIVTYDDFGPAMTAAYQQATNKGIPVVAYGGIPGKDATKAVVSQVASDFCDDGNQMAQTTATMLKNTGNVAFFTGTPGNPQGAGWQACAESWFKKNAPDIQVVNRSNTSWTEGGAVSATTALISTGKKVDAVLYDYAKQTVNIVQTYQQAKQKVPAQVTWTSDNSLLQMWEKDLGTPNEWQLAYSSSINFEGAIALAALMNHLQGKDVPPMLMFPLPFVPAKKGDYLADQPANAPGPTLMPDALLTQVLGAA